MVIGFNHSGFVVADLDVMVGFYRDALGLEVVREVDSVAPPEGDHTGIPGARRRLVFVRRRPATMRSTCGGIAAQGPFQESWTCAALSS